MASPKHYKLGILGGPGVENYSLSPAMHHRALDEMNIDGDYAPIGKGSDECDSWLKSEALTFDGFNVTTPYKGRVWDWIKNKAGGTFSDPDLDEMAAINTVVVEKGQPIGYNTDGHGFLLSLEFSHIDISGKDTVLLGTGGAGRALAFALEKKGIRRLWIWSRKSSIWNARDLAEALNKRRGSKDFAVGTSDKESLPIADCFLLVNATSWGMRMYGLEEPLINPEGLHKGQIVYDIVYEPRETALIKAARNQGCDAIEGWQMLAAQGAASFELFVRQPGIAQKVFPAMREVLIGHYSKPAA